MKMGALFSPEALAEQMGAVELLSAMWSGDGEMVLTDQDEAAIHAVGQFLNLPVASLGDAASVQLKAQIPSAIQVTLVIRPSPELERQQQQQRLGLVVHIPLRKPPGQSSAEETANVQAASLSLSSLSTVSRSTMDNLMHVLDQIRSEQDDIVSHVMTAVEQLSEHILSLTSIEEQSAEKTEVPVARIATAVRRSWYYLPSLSSRDKRADIVQAATTFTPALSGFLLAGKPGLIVLEHPLYATTAEDLAVESTTAAHALDSFWSDIKSHSWGDIPSSHKKISEKLTEAVCTGGGAFAGFHDVTNWPETERAPDRGRKTDLSKVVTWLESRGIDGKASLERCLGVGWA